MEGEGHNKEVASSKFNTSIKKIDTLFMTCGKMAKINTLFMTKTAEKAFPLGSHFTYIAHVREYPPPGL